MLHRPASESRLPDSAAASMDRKLARPGWSRRWGLWSALGAVGLAVATAVGLFLVPPPGTLVVDAQSVEVSEVQRAPFQDYLPVRAAVAPSRTEFIGAVEGGQIEQVIAVDGSLVAAGAPLATLSNPQLKLDVTSREAQIAGQLGDVEAQELTLERSHTDRDQQIAEANFNLLNADRALQIHQQLHDHGIISDVGLKSFADEAAYDRARVAALRAGEAKEDAIAARQLAEVSQTAARLRNNLDVVESSLQALVLRAPVAGRLTNFSLQPGLTLTAGQQVGEVDSEGDDKLVADIDEFYLGRVAVGESASADMGGTAAPLVVAKVLPQVTNGLFRAELTFAGPPPANLKRGQTLDLRITLGDTRPALVVANGPWLAAGGVYAFVMNPDGRRAERRAVSLGRRNPEQVEVTAGLRPGERVVTSSYAGLESIKHLVLNGVAHP